MPALEAAHIRPYGDGGEHEARNGLLLRRDIHSLFDAGYVTVTPDLQFEVSRRIKEEFDNGRHYYELHGKPIYEVQDNLRRPSPEVLRWHNEHVYRGMTVVEMGSDDLDILMRIAAFEHVRRLSEVHAHLTATELKPGFEFKSERIPLINPQRGIFKPQQMRFLLSIKTVFPKPGSKVWYDDQREVHRQIFEGDEMIDYAFMGQNPDAADNRWLREAYENQVPVIYFLGIAPGRYQAMLPTFIIRMGRRGIEGARRIRAARSRHPSSSGKCPGTPLCAARG